MTPIEALKIVHSSIHEELTKGQNPEQWHKLFELVTNIIKENEKLPPFGTGTTSNGTPMELNPTEAIMGFIEYITKTQGVSIGHGHNPRNLDSMIVTFSHANDLPRAGQHWHKIVKFPS